VGFLVLLLTHALNEDLISLTKNLEELILNLLNCTLQIDVLVNSHSTSNFI
jgi:hypothetical protein